MSNVVLSLDGRKEINDRMRKRIDQTGCYDTIVPKFEKLATARNLENYYVRIQTSTKEKVYHTAPYVMEPYIRIKL